MAEARLERNQHLGTLVNVSLLIVNKMLREVNDPTGGSSRHQ